ncbi:hypothetical protein OV203_33680 [Nannocystis sp. ILAH1]|uniref:hypothetical protein n=1 Tax=Nannocystis sp. ILAH1 TaxID=2996789 RepID=UPI00226F3F1B|nr:hypothetical protein [Nannocystis sp. ILAH1]MCY0992137.1 hypothetical protein [Nannocystis sp. ILAH1]
MWPRSRPILLAFGLACGCTPRDGDTSPFTTTRPSTSGQTSTGTTDTSSSTSSSTNDTSGSGGGSKSTTELSTSSSGAVSSGQTTMLYDVGTDVDLGNPKPVGCKGKIDFLFVISRGAGMEYFQAQLLDAFPKFIDTIEAKFADFDYHIMVVDGGLEWGLSYCNDNCPSLTCKVGEDCCPTIPCPNCPNPINYGDLCCGIEDYPCGYTPSACDNTRGAGVVYPAGGDASNKLCKIDGGLRYMAKGQADLKSTFACVAQVGSSGSNRVGEVLAAAVYSNVNAPGGCNDGFLRDDALLMVTLISNTYDTNSKGTPGSWAASVLAAKHDDPESIVMFSILDAMPECHPADRTCPMVNMFPHHLRVDRDEPDYGTFFDQASDLVEVACADFVPPG